MTLKSRLDVLWGAKDLSVFGPTACEISSGIRLGRDENFGSHGYVEWKLWIKRPQPQPQRCTYISGQVRRTSSKGWRRHCQGGGQETHWKLDGKWLSWRPLRGRVKGRSWDGRAEQWPWWSQMADGPSGATVFWTCAVYPSTGTVQVWDYLSQPGLFFFKQIIFLIVPEDKSLRSSHE